MVRLLDGGLDSSDRSKLKLYIIIDVFKIVRRVFIKKYNNSYIVGCYLRSFFIVC